MLFPLSYLAVPTVEGQGVQRRRARRRAARVREANEAIFGLNFLAGYGISHREHAIDVENSDLQVAAVDDILNLVDEGGFDQGSGEGSLREILRGRAGYDSDTTAQGFLAPYQPPLLAVPYDVSQAPFARDIVGPGARSFLDGIKRMLRSQEQSRAPGLLARAHHHLRGPRAQAQSAPLRRFLSPSPRHKAGGALSWLTRRTWFG